MNKAKSYLKPAITTILLLGVGTGVPAFAEDTASVHAGPVSAVEVQEASKEQARLAHEEAVQKAVESVRDDARLNLDIRLIGRTSILVAGES